MKTQAVHVVVVSRSRWIVGSAGTTSVCCSTYDTHDHREQSQRHPRPHAARLIRHHRTPIGLRAPSHPRQESCMIQAMSTPGPDTPPGDLDALAAALVEVRARLAPMVLARHERRRAGATPGERLSTPQHLTLLALADGPLTMTALAGATGVALSTATRMVQSLVREGWVAARRPRRGRPPPPSGGAHARGPGGERRRDRAPPPPHPGPARPPRRR